MKVEIETGLPEEGFGGMVVDVALLGTGFTGRELGTSEIALLPSSHRLIGLS